MDIKLDKALCKKYPKIFADRHKSPQETLICFGCECESGWYWLIDNLCRAITEHIRDNKDVEQVVATQVKEKFGQLRFYYNGGDDYINGAVWFAEKLSYHICEVCGATEDVKQTKGWIRSLCPKCMKKDNKEFFKRFGKEKK